MKLKEVKDYNALYLFRNKLINSSFRWLTGFNLRTFFREFIGYVLLLKSKFHISRFGTILYFNQPEKYFSKVISSDSTCQTEVIGKKPVLWISEWTMLFAALFVYKSDNFKTRIIPLTYKIEIWNAFNYFERTLRGNIQNSGFNKNKR